MRTVSFHAAPWSPASSMISGAGAYPLIYAQIRPAQLKQAVEFYQGWALALLTCSSATHEENRTVFES